MTKNTPTAWTSLSLDPDPEPRCLNVPQLPSLDGLEGLAEVLFMALFGFISLIFGALTLDFRDQHVGWAWPAVVCGVFTLPVVLDIAARVFETVRYVRYSRSDSYVRRWHSRHDCPENPNSARGREVARTDAALAQAREAQGALLADAHARLDALSAFAATVRADLDIADEPPRETT